MSVYGRFRRHRWATTAAALGCTAGLVAVSLAGQPAAAAPAAAAWSIANGALDAGGSSAGSAVGLLNRGSSWTDYTATFDFQIVDNQAGWIVRGTSANDGYVFILDTAADSSGIPNVIQEFDLHGGRFTSVGSTSLGWALSAGEWHTVATVVSGTSVSVSMDGRNIANINSSSFPAGDIAYSAGTVGFREYSGEEANFKNLSVVSGSGATLYSNPLNTAANLTDFTVPSR